MDNKEKILQTALYLYSNNGFDSVGIQDIVDRSGVTKPTLYHYFNSKEGLIEELLDSQYHNLIRRLNISANYSGDLPLTINKTVKTFFNFAKNNREYYRILLYLQYLPVDNRWSEVSREYILKIFKTLDDMFEKMATHHGNLKGKNKNLTVSFMGVINSYINLYLNDPGKLNEDLAFTVSHQFMHGIYA
ncbi:MAG: hypothetical protein PWQ77_1142 [Kosmotogales bacterium]|nr:hypothetical protein [Kosmotogales bacterium]